MFVSPRFTSLRSVAPRFKYYTTLEKVLGAFSTSENGGETFNQKRVTQTNYDSNKSTKALILSALVLIGNLR